MKKFKILLSVMIVAFVAVVAFGINYNNNENLAPEPDCEYTVAVAVEVDESCNGVNPLGYVVLEVDGVVYEMQEAGGALIYYFCLDAVPEDNVCAYLISPMITISSTTDCDEGPFTSGGQTNLTIVVTCQ